MWKNVHPVYGAGIRTHNLRYVSLYPLPLDQGSRPVPDFYLLLLLFLILLSLPMLTKELETLISIERPF